MNTFDINKLDGDLSELQGDIENYLDTNIQDRITKRDFPIKDEVDDNGD